MRNSGLFKTTVAAAIAGGLLAAPSVSQAVSPSPNPWFPMRFLNIAHQGGEDEAPSNTLFALKSAVADRGADMLELDVNLSQDGELMVIHDDSVDRTTNGPTLRDDSVMDTDGDPATDSSEVDQLTTAQIQALDAGHSFREGGNYTRDTSVPASEFPYRGIANGAVPPPPGYVADDFQIPTLREVLDAFPTTPINIEIKMEKSIGGAGMGCETEPSGLYCDDAAGSVPIAEELAVVLDDPAYEGRQDIIAVSFSELLTQTFHDDDAVPQTPLAPATEDVIAYAVNGATPNPDVAAFQVPPSQGVLDVASLIMARAPADGYAVHVFPNGDEPESEAGYQRMLDLGVNGYMASEPLRLHNFLCAAGVRRPDGSARCPAQDAVPTILQPPTTTPTQVEQKKCKKGKKLKKGKCVKKKKKKKGKKKGKS